MKKILSGASLVLAVVSTSFSVSATEPVPHPLRLGFGIDIGAPSGVALGLVVHPKIDWVSAQLSVTHNAINFGGRGSVKLDPLAIFPNLPIGLFGDLQAGIAGRGNVPSVSEAPPLGYNYVNLYGGLRLGKPNGFHWNFEAGPSYLVAKTSDFQGFVSKNTSGDVRVSNPTVSAWITPTFITGFEVVWP